MKIRARELAELYSRLHKTRNVAERRLTELLAVKAERDDAERELAELQDVLDAERIRSGELRAEINQARTDYRRAWDKQLEGETYLAQRNQAISEREALATQLSGVHHELRQARDAHMKERDELRTALAEARQQAGIRRHPSAQPAAVWQDRNPGQEGKS